MSREQKPSQKDNLKQREHVTKFDGVSDLPALREALEIAVEALEHYYTILPSRYVITEAEINSQREFGCMSTARKALELIYAKVGGG